MRKSLRVTAAGAVAALALTLTGCAGANPSAAAIVDGHEISQRQVAESTRGVAEAFGLTADRIDSKVVVGALISGVQAQELAARHNITITDAERDASLSQEETGIALLKHPVAKEIAYDLADAQIVAGKLGEQRFVEETKAMNVKLNPVYGTWEQGQMTGQSGSLSRALNPAQPTG